MIDLKVNASQKKIVADNICSLAEAYANVADGRYAQPFGIYNGEVPVGFLMIGYNIVEEEDLEKYPVELPEGWDEIPAALKL